MASLTRVLDQLDRYLTSDLESDAFLQLEISDKSAEWKESATQLVTDVIRPAFAEYRSGLAEHIAPVARPDDKCGLVWMDSGEKLYASLIHKYTQLDKTPQEIHEVGQKWATELNAAEWAEIGQKAFGLDTKQVIFERLQSDPSLRFHSEDEMLEHARETIARAWESVDEWFGVRPETPCEVVPVPRATAPALPPAFYMQPPIDGSRNGTYFLNTYKPEERDRFEYESIHFHEAVPGHHFDRSLASELDGIPPPRRYARCLPTPRAGVCTRSVWLTKWVSTPPRWTGWEWSRPTLGEPGVLSPIPVCTRSVGVVGKPLISSRSGHRSGC